eukprot:CAMPEP_0114605584 /NCGR_PEP_ID=MMETSP0168-20121206/1129_1 /TAXON_ID=95228 ORGANISM="Vannella sp., Strain DIVA3 517/6/12" /NCGR_SAMPLE_ID=MMETSP0168 /ASSEMBLY_ACC=CAM_ASM_000044 /LENGTH=229 /DNA_ID=CAMNT_0001816437 /DNA_START=150 /DNA_END=839 /DNA_ORIENTATION=+
MDIFKLGGKGLMKRFGYVLEKALKDAYPEAALNTMEWNRKPRNFWASIANRRAFLDTLAKEKGVQAPADWQRVSTTDVRQAGGSGLLSHYASFAEALADTYHEHSDVMDKANPSAWRRKAPQNHWDSEENVAAFMRRAKEELHVKENSDWLRVSRAQLQSVQGGHAVLQKMTFTEALDIAFPSVQWKELTDTTSGHRKAAQRLMRAHLTAILASDSFSGSDFATAMHES